MFRKPIFIIVPIVLVIAAAAVIWFLAGSRDIGIALMASPTPQGEPWPERLKNPPQTVKAVYATIWTAATAKQIDYLINIATSTEINAIVIDVKDYTGHISFETQSPLIKSVGSEEIQLKDLNKLINKLHEKNIYAIARITVFQDPVLAMKRPALAIKSKKTGANWKDHKGLSWVDPASPEVWNYIVTVAKETERYGFDELNFDYVRFPSDGDMKDLVYPFYNAQRPKHEVLGEFFKYLSDNLRPSGIKISADLFGLAAVNKDDLGIGQVLEDAAPYFDFICPMVYPSHYASGFLGYTNPAAYPYEIIKYSLENAQKRLNAMIATPTPNLNATTTPPTSAAGGGGAPTSLSASVGAAKFAKVAELRPWLQDFDMGATYDAAMVRLEKKAVTDLGLSSGWLLWDPKNIYTVSALDPEVK